jgi:hypothetical protein
VYFEQASERVYKKNSGDKQTRESRLPNVLITGEFGLPDVLCLQTISNFKLFMELFVFIIDSLAKNTPGSQLESLS